VGSLRLPIPLEAGTEHVQYGESFRLREDEQLGWVLELEGSDGWQDLYAFRLDRVVPADIVMANHFTSTFPASPFRRFPMLARPHEHGRITMSGDRIVHYGAGQPRVEQAPTGAELLELLRDAFHIELDVGPDELPGWPQP
jgi:N-hydroxyarylamine O-acetyltransferase